jgi:hypothetical protein
MQQFSLNIINFKTKSLLIFCGILITLLKQIEEINAFTNGENFSPNFKLDEIYQEYIKFHENKENKEKDFLGISTIADELIIEKSKLDTEIQMKTEKENLINLNPSVDNCLNSAYVNDNKDLSLSLSDNQKFILGKCNPVLFIPGFLSTRLVANIDCPNLMKDNSAMEELRFFCGNTICQKGFFYDYKNEEYTLWPSLFDSPFKLYIDKSNPDNSCMSYVMRIFKNEEECPRLNNKENNNNSKPICLYSKYIKVTYSGNTEKTKENLQCGIKPVSRILDPGYSIIPEKAVNSGFTAVYYNLAENLKSKGYKEGFSMAGLPYDFRVLSKENGEFEQNFMKMVEMLYNNTGKKVVITSHSLGNIFTNDILSNFKNKEKLDKMIERYIAVLPPYIGTSKDTELFLTGTEEFKSDIFAGMKINISKPALDFMGAFNPNFYILFLQPFLENLSNKNEYKKFTEAIIERINLERECKSLIEPNSNKAFNNNKCNDDFIEKNSQKFSEIFPFIPKLNSNVCKNLYKKAIEDMKNSNFFNEKSDKRNDIYEFLPTYDPCFLRIFDFLNCPLIKVNKDKSKDKDKENKLSNDFSIEDFEKFCLNDNDNDNDNLNKEENKEEKINGKINYITMLFI